VGPALTGVIGGEVQMMFANVGAVTPQVKSGKIKALAVASAQPTTLMPGVPTVASTVPGYESTSAYGVVVPAKTPASVIARLNQEIVRAINKPDIKEKFTSGGIETIGSSPEVLTAKMKSEMARMGKIIKDLGIREE